MNEAKWWITLSDNGYQLARFVAKPPNAVRGPYATYDEVVAETKRMESRSQSRGEMVGWLMAGWLVFFVSAGVYWGWRALS